jgi:hypothetical protein
VIQLPRWLIGSGALVLALAGCRGLRASSVPLGGKHEEEAPAEKVAQGQGASESEADAGIEEVPAVVATAPANPGTSTSTSSSSASTPPSSASPATESAAEGSKTAPSGAFVLKPYAAQQAWTRVFDLEFELKVGQGGSVDMRMKSHQEARFEVLAVSNGAIDKLAIEYPVYKTTLTIMGNSQESPEELAGKRFVITFAQGKPEVRDASGGTPPKKQVDSVKDDAREPLEIEKALKELAQLTSSGRGRGDFSAKGAVALAGGEDEDTKVSQARGSLKNVVSGPQNQRTALIDLGYTLTNAVDESSTIEVQVAGTLSVLDGPARYQSSTLQGPMELRSKEPGGMAGRGTIKVTTSYKY